MQQRSLIKQTKSFRNVQRTVSCKDIIIHLQYDVRFRFYRLAAKRIRCIDSVGQLTGIARDLSRKCHPNSSFIRE